MGGLSFSHIVILLLVFLLVFGAKRIPEIGASLGQGIKEFKKSLRETTEDDRSGSLPPGAPSSREQTPTPPSGGEPKRLNR